MPYTMDFEADGACRDNGNPEKARASWAVVYKNYPLGRPYRRGILKDGPPTNQRAELYAIKEALNWALDDYEYNLPNLWPEQIVKVNISSDSEYAINCVSVWVRNWKANGWINAHGLAVVNRDLIKDINDLQNAFEYQCGVVVNYTWNRRYRNSLADHYCNEALNEYERQARRY